MKTLKEYKTWLPSFPGFYDTYIGGDFDLDDYLYENDLSYDDLEIDYTSYQEDQSKSYCKFIQKLLKENFQLENKVIFEKLISPQFYNFVNDSVNITIELDQKRLVELINENYETLKQSIKEDYTSRDGFTSFHSNDIEDWKSNTKNWTNFDNLHYLGYLLGVLIELHYDNNANDVYDRNNTLAMDFIEFTEVYLHHYIAEKKNL